jgi:hypothetical protein
MAGIGESLRQVLQTERQNRKYESQSGDEQNQSAHKLDRSQQKDSRM